MKKIGLMACLLLVSAYAQESPTASVSAEVRKVKVRTVSLRPSSPEYPAELVAAGVQGTTEVLAKLGPDGKPVDVSVAQTSRSPLLDEAALTLVQGLSFKFKDDAVTAPLPMVVVPVEFMRDSVSTLAQKSCQDLNTDLQYFTTTFPEKKPEDLAVVKMATGILTIAAMSNKMTGDAFAAYAKSLKRAVPAALAECATHPTATFLEVLKQSIKDANATHGS